jgi:hypothetical protein
MAYFGNKMLDLAHLLEHNKHTKAVHMILRYKGKPYVIELDDQDLHIAANHNWFLSNRDGKLYVTDRKTYLHRAIMGHPKTWVDHIDGNPLNNSRSNLRICLPIENSQNRLKNASRYTSKYSGVSWSADADAWRVSYTANKVWHHVGYFTCEIEAAKAYNNHILKHNYSFRAPNSV